MKIIRIVPNENGSRPPLQEWHSDNIPETHALCPDEFVSIFDTSNGFVSVTIGNGAVTSMTENVEARKAWEALPKPEPKPTPEETLGQTVASLTVENIDLKNQVQMLAQTVATMQIGGQA